MLLYVHMLYDTSDFIILSTRLKRRLISHIQYENVEGETLRNFLQTLTDEDWWSTCNASKSKFIIDIFDIFRMYFLLCCLRSQFISFTRNFRKLLPMVADITHLMFFQNFLFTNRAFNSRVRAKFNACFFNSRSFSPCFGKKTHYSKKFSVISRYKRAALHAGQPWTSSRGSPLNFIKGNFSFRLMSHFYYQSAV